MPPNPIALMRRRRRGGNVPFAIQITGLTGGSAIEGDQLSIGYTITPDNGTETVKWSDSSNPADAATYGTGANPTDFTGGTLLWLHVTDGGETVSTFAPIAAPGEAVLLESGDTLLLESGDRLLLEA